MSVDSTKMSENVTPDEVGEYAQHFLSALYFHGTTADRIASIIAGGLLVSQGGSGAAQHLGADEVQRSRDRVFFTKTSRVAQGYYHDEIFGKRDGEVLLILLPKNLQDRVESDGASSSEDKSYWLKADVPASYIFRGRPRADMDDAIIQAVGSYYPTGSKPALAKLRKMHQVAVDDGYLDE